jgi:hypothetical protein
MMCLYIYIYIYIYLYIYHPEPRISCWMPYLICISHVICCIPASFKFGVWTSCTKTCSNTILLDVFVACALCWFREWMLAICTEWVLSKQSVLILRSRCYSLSNIQMNCLLSVFLFWSAAVIWGQVLTVKLILNVKWIFNFK